MNTGEFKITPVGGSGKTLGTQTYRVDTDNERLIRLGRHIRRLRRDRDLSQEALAELASIHRNHLGALERGTKVAGVATLFRVADALGVTPAALFAPFEGKS